MGLKVDTIQNPSSATVNLTLDTSGNVAVGNNLTVTGTTSLAAVNSSGLITGATGALYPVVQGTAQASTSGTSIDFTGIPSWAKRVSIILSGVSINPSGILLIQLGSGSVTNTGYASGGWQSSATYATATNGMLVGGGQLGASLQHGVYTLALVTGNTWVGSGSVADSSGSAYNGVGGGTIALSGALDRIRVTTVTGTPTFDTGSIINIQYE
jgi:hypothetical protein